MVTFPETSEIVILEFILKTDDAWRTYQANKQYFKDVLATIVINCVAMLCHILLNLSSAVTFVHEQN